MEFSARPLFSDVSFVVNPKERIALVGKNGAGKSTLLKIIAGIQNPTGGVVARQKDVTVAYLPQVMVLSDSCTVMEEAEKAFEHISEMQLRIQKLNDQLAERTDYESQEYMDLVEKFTHENERFDLMGGQNYHAELERTLVGLGFRKEDFNRPTSEFSGGWRMRIELAKLLLQFINNVTNRTIEITCGHINDYKVKYDQYVVLRDERREQQLRAYENQQKEIAETKAFIEKFRYKPTKSNQVQSRMKALEKMQLVEVDDIDTSHLNLKFPKCQRSGDFPVICDEVRKTYGNHLVFDRVNLTIKRGEKVAFVGNNGEGKSTLVKCIMDEIPFDGQLKVGHNVQIGYFAQNQAQLLDPDITVFDTIDRVATGDMRTKVRDILGAFMFGGEASDKFVKVLSGGLILDEPTNHLDMQSKDVLKRAVKDFDGTVIVVSHDRDFLDGLVDRVYEFADGKVREHIGGIYDFLEMKRMENEGLTGVGENVNARTEPQKTGGPELLQEKEVKANDGALSYEQQKELAKIKRKAEKRVKDAEQLIEQLEQQIAEIEEKMTTPEGASDVSLFTRHAEIKAKLSEAEDEWEEASIQLEEMG